MTCPKCGHPHTSINHMVRRGENIERARKCERCGCSFKTVESKA